MGLYDFQVAAKLRTYEEWHKPNVFNVILNVPTGGGKTVLFCDIVREFNAPACVIAHRQELISQASLALNREGLQHDILAPKDVKQQIIRAHHDIHGTSYYRGGSSVRVAGVNSRITCQAVNASNTNAGGLFPTAHAVRADGRGL